MVVKANTISKRETPVVVSEGGESLSNANSSPEPHSRADNFRKAAVG